MRVMSASDQQRFRWIATAVIVAMLLLLAICFIFVGLTRAAAISGVVSMFVAAATLLIALWTNGQSESVGAIRKSPPSREISMPRGSCG